MYDHLLYRLITIPLFFTLSLLNAPLSNIPNPCDEPHWQFLPVLYGASLRTPTEPVAGNHTDGIASWGSPIALSPTTATVWTVNPDAGSVSAIDTQQQQKIAEIPIGEEPWSLVIAPTGDYIYVTDRATGKLSKIAVETQSVVMSTYVGSELGAIALTPSGRRAYITSMSAHDVSIVDTSTLEITNRIPVSTTPYAIGITDDGDGVDDDEQVVVTHLTAFARPGGVEATDQSREGRVTLIDPCMAQVTSQIVLAPDENGFPNLLAGLSIRERRAWVPLVRAAPDLPNTLSKTVFAAVSALDLTAGREEQAAGLPLNDQDVFGSPTNNPVAVVPAPDGKTLYIVLAGSDLVEVVDISDRLQPQLVGFLAVSANPRGMAINQDGSRGYVMNYLARSVTLLDLDKMMSITEIPVTDETLDEAVLRGKILFNNAVDPRLSRGSWISCASCHPDGGTDSITWMFPDGPRQTPPLWNAVQTLPWHWSAALDEPHDVEQTIHLIQHGLGLAPGTDAALLAEPNAGRSADLDALAAFMARGVRIPQFAAEENAGGRRIFQQAGCPDCHGGATWTSRALPGAPGTLDPDGDGMVNSVLRQVGTLNPRDVRGNTGFAPPSLLNVALTAPYFHDGSAPTLDVLLQTGHPDPDDTGSGLDESAMTELVHFLRSIRTVTQPFE